MLKVSIILPVYNAEKTIATTIESILAQTTNDYKLIIINDGSVDKTDEICRNYADKNEEIIEYHSISNKGVSNARNLGIEYSDTKYIMFIDSDDLYKEDMLKKMIEQIEDEEVDLVTCGYVRKILANGRERNTSLPYMLTQNKIEYIEKLQAKSLFNQIWNKIYKLEIIKNNNIKFNCNISIGEDLRFNLNYINNSRKMIFLDDLLYVYNSSDSGLNFKYQKNMMYVKLENIEFQNKIYEKESHNKKYIYELYVLTCLSGLSNIVKNVKKREALEEIKYFKINKKIQNELRDIGKFKQVSTKTKIILMFLKSKSVHLIYYISKVTITIKKIYRRIFVE